MKKPLTVNPATRAPDEQSRCAQFFAVSKLTFLEFQSRRSRSGLNCWTMKVSRGKIETKPFSEYKLHRNIFTVSTCHIIRCWLASHFSRITKAPAPPRRMCLSKKGGEEARKNPFGNLHDTDAFVAASDDMIAVVFRGTMGIADWYTNAKVKPKKCPQEWGVPPPGGTVHTVRFCVHSVRLCQFNESKL